MSGLPFAVALGVLGLTTLKATGATNYTHHIPNVAAGAYHVVGLKEDGTVIAAGDNSVGQCEVGAWTGIVQIAAGFWHTVGLKADGTVVAVGLTNDDQCNVSGWTHVAAVAAGSNSTVGITTDGLVLVASSAAELTEGADLTCITGIAAGGGHIVGMMCNTMAIAWGRSDSGQCYVQDWSYITAVAAGDSHTVGLTEDGRVLAVGNNGYGQCNVSGWSNIVAVAAGELHTVGLKTDRTVVAIGAGSSGQTNVAGWSNVIAIAAGRRTSVGLKADGTVIESFGRTWEWYLNGASVPPIITRAATYQPVLANRGASFSVTVAGPGSIRYQWYKDGTALMNGECVTGVTSTNLVIAGVEAADAGNYTVVATNQYGATTSAIVPLTLTIPVGPAGTGVLTFDAQPRYEWTTLYLPGSSALIRTTDELDATIQGLAASRITNALPATATLPPSTSTVGMAARWNSRGYFLQTRPAAGSASVLMAVLMNNTGAAQRSLDLGYDMAEYEWIGGELRGYRVYYSLTGASNGWHVISALSGIETTATLRTTVTLDHWADGALLYLLWADDNGQTFTDPAYTIDNFSVVPTPRLTITRPRPGQADLEWIYPTTRYQLQVTSDLNSTAWEAVTEPDALVDAYHRVTVDTSSGTRFYRLISVDTSGLR